MHPEAAAPMTLLHNLLGRHQGAARAHSHLSVMPHHQSAAEGITLSVMLMGRNLWLVQVLKAAKGAGLLRLIQKSKQTTYETYETELSPLHN